MPEIIDTEAALPHVANQQLGGDQIVGAGRYVDGGEGVDNTDSAIIRPKGKGDGTGAGDADTFTPNTLYFVRCRLQICQKPGVIDDETVGAGVEDKGDTVGINDETMGLVP